MNLMTKNSKMWLNQTRWMSILMSGTVKHAHSKMWLKTGQMSSKAFAKCVTLKVTPSKLSYSFKSSKDSLFRKLVIRIFRKVVWSMIRQRNRSLEVGQVLKVRNRGHKSATIVQISLLALTSNESAMVA
jgi:hypothetical protein